MDLLLDMSAGLSYEDVLSARYAKRFARSTKDAPSYGITRGAVWVRFEVVNRSITRGTWLLDTSLALHVEYVDFHSQRVGGPAESPRASGRELGGADPTVVKTGIARPFTARDLSHRNFVFRIPLEPGEHRLVHLRFFGANEIVLPLALYSPSAFQAKDHTELLIHGLYFGALLVMALFNLLVAISLRDATYGWYVAYISGFGLWMLATTQVGLQFLWPASGVFGHRLVFHFGWLGTAAALQFTRSFLGTRRRSPRLDRVLWAFLALNLSMPLVGSLLSWRFYNQMGSLVLVVEPLLILGTAGWMWRAGFRPARVFLLAWTLLCLSWIIAGLYLSGMLGGGPFGLSPLFIAEVGSALEVALLSLALTDRINSLRSARDEARTRATIAQQFTRYFPHTLVERILNTEMEVRLESQRRLVTVIFADLRGFTALSDGLPPERVGQILNDYLGAMVRLMEDHGCTLDKTMGDGVMGFFGAPDDMGAREQAERAVRLALAMQRGMSELCAFWSARGLEHDLLLRVGIHQDEVTVGHFGTEELLSYTVVGSGVNLAARLESGATPGRILVSETVQSLVPEAFPWEEPREQSFKGFARPRRVVELDPARVKTDPLSLGQQRPGP